jgi:hypothetical protein
MVPLPEGARNEMPSVTYFTLLATMHCMLIQQPQLFDASLVCF